MKDASRWIGVAAVGVVLCIAAVAMAEDWPQWRGANRDGKAAVAELLHSRLVEGQVSGWGAGGGGGDHADVSPSLAQGGTRAPGGKQQLLCIADSLVDMPMLQLGCVEPIVVPHRPAVAAGHRARPDRLGGVRGVRAAGRTRELAAVNA